MAEQLDFTVDLPSTPTALTKKPSEIDLDNVSKNVGGNWRSLLTHLGVPSTKCKALLQESCGSSESACFQGLVFWREGNKPCKEASWSVLLEALQKGAERGDYAETLRAIIIENATTQSPNPHHITTGDRNLQKPPHRARSTSVVRVHHPLENTFHHLCDNIQRIVAEDKHPPLEDMKRYCIRLLKDHRRAVRRLRRASKYEEVLDIVFVNSDWMSFNNIEMMVDYFKLDAVEEMIDDYKSKLSSVLTRRLTQIKEKMTDLPPEHPIGRADLEKMVIEYNLDADGITLEDLLRHRQFLSSRLNIPNHLLSFLKVLIGSVILVFGVPEELVPGVVKMIEEVWRELWRERIVSIEVKGRVYDLLKMTNVEKERYIPKEKTKQDWGELLTTVRLYLYEEYGRHPSLQSAVQTYKEAGDPKAVERGSLHWLFYHHVPEESCRLLVDPYAVLGRTLFLGGCDMSVVRVAMRRISPVAVDALKRWEVLYRDQCDGMRCTHIVYTRPCIQLYMLRMHEDVLTAELPWEWAKLLYNKYCHLKRKVGVVEDVQNMSEEELEGVKEWLWGWFRGRSRNVVKALVECGIDDEEVWGFVERLHSKLSAVVIPRDLDPRRWRYEESERMTLEQINQKLESEVFNPLSGEKATEEGQDIFEAYFKHLLSQYTPLPDLLVTKNKIRSSLPAVYQQDLKEAFHSVVTPISKESVPMETSPSHKSHSESSAVHSPTSHSLGVSDVGIATTALSEVKRQFQLQLSGVFPLFSKDDKISQLEVMLSSLTVHTDTPDLLFHPSDVENVRQELLQYWWWFDSSFLQPVMSTLLGEEGVEKLKMFEMNHLFSLSRVSVDKSFPQPLTDFPLLPGYIPVRVHLPHPPTKITMDELWELKKTICSSLHLHSYALLLKGYMRGSTDVIFSLATTAKVPPERVCRLMMSSDVVIHSTVFGCGTSHEVKYTLRGFLSEMDHSELTHDLDEMNLKK